MKKFGVGIAALLIVAMTFAVTRAQDAEPLTQTFTAYDGSYLLMYPANWSLDEQSGAVNVATDVSGAQAFIVYTDLTGPLEDAPAHAVDFLANGGYKTVSAGELQLNGHRALQYQLPLGDKVFDVIALDTGNGKVMVAVFIAGANQIQTLDPTLQAILASFQEGTGGGAIEVPVATPDATNSRSRIALSVQNGTGQALLLTDLSGQMTKIVNRGGYITGVKWSHDGTKLAFLSQPGADISVGNLVFVTDAAGNHVQAITEQPSAIDHVVWSPDDTQLIFSVPFGLSGGLEAGIYKINADGSGLTKLPPERANNELGSALDWSPDGKQILFSVYVENRSTLFFADADGSHSAQAPWNAGTVHEVLWSPDGQHLLIEDLGLTVENTDGSHPVNIVDYNEKWSISAISWSPDGSQVAFQATTPADSLDKLYIANSDGSNRRVLNIEPNFGLPGVSWGEIAESMEAVSPAKATPEVQSTAVESATEGSVPSTVSTACTATANGTANLRSGPGTSFAKAGALTAGASASVTGQATGADGKVWYQLDGGSYVRSDLVKADGDCASVPTVTP